MPARVPSPTMGIATKTSHTNKCIFAAYAKSFNSSKSGDIEQAIKSIFSADAKIDAFHPVNETKGAIGYYRDIISPILKSFRGFQRRDNIIIGGEYLGGEWVATTGYFLGHFEHTWLGIPPSGKLEHIRFGEFHRMIDGEIVESQIFLGVAELLIDLGIWPLELMGGYEGVTPGPSTQDGISMTENEPVKSKATADLVEGMLMELASPDAAWIPYWDERMIWYGPGGFGSYVTTEAFAAFQVPFENTFEGWGDGVPQGILGVGSQCKAGDGDYAFLSGWPQITGIHVKPFMGIQPTNKRIYMRDCDWWLCKDGKIIENWCMVDTLHLVHQLGRDILNEISS